MLLNTRWPLSIEHQHLVIQSASHAQLPILRQLLIP